MSTTRSGLDGEFERISSTADQSPGAGGAKRTLIVPLAPAAITSGEPDVGIGGSRRKPAPLTIRTSPIESGAARAAGSTFFAWAFFYVLDEVREGDSYRLDSEILQAEQAEEVVLREIEAGTGTPQPRRPDADPRVLLAPDEELSG